MIKLNEAYLQQLDFAIDQYKLVTEKDTLKHSYFCTIALNAVYRISGKDSIYFKQIDKYKEDKSFMYYDTRAKAIVGVLMALKEDIKNGFLETLKENIKGELFSDFLEMANVLLNDGYKDAAAVIGGGVLESHLRQLCIKFVINTLDANGKAKKADTLNSELAKESAYNLLDQKSITAWLDLRNKAAHARYGEYTKDQVLLMLQGIGNFIARCPA